MRTKKSSPKKADTYRLYGRHAVLAALANEQREIKRLWLSERVVDEAPTHWQQRATIADRPALDKLVESDAIHQGFVAEVVPLASEPLKHAVQYDVIVLLDQVTDPHNVGAIMRSAAAFGAGALVQTKDHAPHETAVMAKSASGTLEILPRIIVTNLSQAIKTLQKDGFWCIGLDGYAENLIGNIPHYDRVALVLGAEGKGLRKGVADQCDLLVKLPIDSAVESLNVSNAAAVALYALAAQNQT